MTGKYSFFQLQSKRLLNKCACVWYNNMKILKFRYLTQYGLKRWIRLVKEKDVISGRDALKRRLEAKVLCAVPDYIPFSMREH